MNCIVRKNTTLADKTFLSSLAGMPVRNVALLENVRGPIFSTLARTSHGE